jgi:phage gp46-like protein
MARKFNTTTGRWDWARNEDYQLHTAITLTLLTDTRALPSDGIKGNQRGWWGSSFSAFPGWQMGTRLWTLRGRPITPGLVADAQRIAEDGLAWLVDDGAVGSVSVPAYREGDTLQLPVWVTQPGEGADPELVDIWRIAING